MANKKGGLVIKELESAKLVTWAKSVLSKIKLQKGSRAGVIVNRNGVPQLFVFDTPAFLDVLSAIDEALLDRLSDEEYNNPKINIAGYLLDEVEARLPLNPKFVQSLKDAIEEAKKKGWISFPKIQRTFGLK